MRQNISKIIQNIIRVFMMVATEMEKRADASVLFFSLAVLIFGLCTHNLVRHCINSIVLSKSISTVLVAQCQ